MSGTQPSAPYRSLSKPSKGALPLLTTLILWSSAMVAIRYSVISFHPGSMALLRLLSGSAAMSLILINKHRHPALTWKEISLIFWLGFLVNAVYQTCLSYGEQTVTAGIASFLISTIPLYTAIGAVLLKKEKMTGLSWLGVLISFCGTLIIAIGEAEHSTMDIGVLFIIISAISASIYLLSAKSIINKIGPVRSTAYILWAGTLFLLFYTPQLYQDLQTAPLSATLTVLYLGIFPTAIGYITYNLALYHLSTTIASQWLYLIPLITCFLAFLFLGEIPTITAVLGGFIALIGTIVVTVYGRAKT